MRDNRVFIGATPENNHQCRDMRIKRKRDRKKKQEKKQGRNEGGKKRKWGERNKDMIIQRLPQVNTGTYLASRLR